MDLNNIAAMAGAITRLAETLGDCSPAEVIELLEGSALSEEDAGELRRFLDIDED